MFIVLSKGSFVAVCNRSQSDVLVLRLNSIRKEYRLQTVPFYETALTELFVCRAVYCNV